MSANSLHEMVSETLHLVLQPAPAETTMPQILGEMQGALDAHFTQAWIQQMLNQVNEMNLSEGDFHEVVACCVLMEAQKFLERFVQDQPPEVQARAKKVLENLGQQLGKGGSSSGSSSAASVAMPAQRSRRN